MSKIDIDKFVEHLIKLNALDINAVQSALFAQGLTFCGYKIQKIGEIKENPKWTEEDEDMVESIIDYLKPMPIFFETTKGKSGKEYTKEFIKRAIKWIKTIEQRMKEC